MASGSPTVRDAVEIAVRRLDRGADGIGAV
jgi:hypothetical protein